MSQESQDSTQQSVPQHDLIHDAMQIGVTAGVLYKRSMTEKQIAKAVRKVMRQLGCPVELVMAVQAENAEVESLERMLGTGDTEVTS
jgi:hypothetical protein